MLNAFREKEYAKDYEQYKTEQKTTYKLHCQKNFGRINVECTTHGKTISPTCIFLKDKIRHIEPKKKTILKALCLSS